MPKFAANLSMMFQEIPDFLDRFDAAAKAAVVRLIEMQLARGIGGKAYFVLTGALAEIEAAVEAGLGAVAAGLVCGTEIIAAPHDDLVARLR